jgi:tRNA pseudouridine(38-40) synthase
MTRYRLDVQFRGEHFLGWDRAANYRAAAAANARRPAALASSSAALSDARSVRDAVQDALCVALDIDEAAVVPSVITETGVHARRMTCHVDIPSDVEMQPRTVLQRAHVWLQKKGDPLAILSFDRAPRGFHCRYSATRRVYLYKVLNRVAPPLLEQGQHWHIDRSLDVDAMRRAAAFMQGTHDFGAFADHRIARTLDKAGANAATRTLERLEVAREGDEVLVWAVGRSFLRHQLRSIVGVLRFVGQGLWDAEEVRLFMARGFSRSPSAALLKPPAAPVHGLTLWAVEYPATFEAPAAFVDSGPLEVTDADRPVPGEVPEVAAAAEKAPSPAVEDEGPVGSAATAGMFR